MKLINKKQTGFTLIELIIVIVILGILAVTAAPKFLNLQGDALNATLDGVKGSLESARTVVYGKAIIDGKQAQDGTAGSVTVAVQTGVTVEINFGYPEATSTDLDKLIDINSADFLYATIAASDPVEIIIYSTAYGDYANTAPTTKTANCSVLYTEASSATAPATVVNNGNCGS